MSSSSVLVVGQGAVGRALVAGLRARKFEVQGIGARQVVSVFGHDTIIYAGGPAGEAACRADPAAAFKWHYTYPMALVDGTTNLHPGGRTDGPLPSSRRLVLIGTVLPSVGFYGALKELTFEHARDQMLTAAKGDAVLALRCGQIIGPEMPVDGAGVVATWVRQAVRHETLIVEHSPPLTVSLCSEVIDRIAEWLRAPITSAWAEERVCHDPLALWTLADMVHAATGDPRFTVHTSRDYDELVFAALCKMAENAARAMQVSP